MNLFSLLGNIFLITLLGVLIAFSPLLIMVNLIIVLKSKRPIMNTLVLVAGIITPLIIVAVLGQVFISPSTVISLGDIASKIELPTVIAVLFGLSLIVYGLRRLVDYQKSHKSKSIKPLSPPLDKPKSLYIFGFVKSLLSVTNVFAILFLVQLLKSIHPSLVVGSLAFIWVLIVGLFPLLLTLFFGAYQPQRLETINKRVNDLLKTNLQLVIIAIVLISGGYFLFVGLGG